MFLTILFFLLGIGYTVLFTYLVDLMYLIPVWIILGFIASFISLIVILIVIYPIFKFTKPNRKFKYVFLKDVSQFINFFLRIKVTAVGTENIPKDGNLTIYANHKSKNDPFLIMAHMNRPLAFTPKISIYKIPVVSWYMHALGCLPIDRSDNRRTAKTMISAIKNVQDGLAMLIFPEGGILSRNEDKMVDIKAGAYKIGMKAKSDFLPVSIIGNSKIINKKWYQKMHIKLIFHPVVKYEDVKDLNTIELGEKMFEIINKDLD